MTETVDLAELDVTEKRFKNIPIHTEGVFDLPSKPGFPVKDWEGDRVRVENLPDEPGGSGGSYTPPDIGVELSFESKQAIATVTVEQGTGVEGHTADVVVSHYADR